jgi:hypothetical protein
MTGDVQGAISSAIPARPAHRETVIGGDQPIPCRCCEIGSRLSSLSARPRSLARFCARPIIELTGRDITIVLNGEKTAELRKGMFDEGSIALQHGAGTIKFRKVQIKPM